MHDAQLRRAGLKLVADPRLAEVIDTAELPGIVDQVITMASLPDELNRPQRAFVCQTLNPWGYPAKDRSGRLDLVEEPHLGRLMEKIRGPLIPAERRLTYSPPQLPAPPGAPATDTHSYPTN